MLQYLFNKEMELFANLKPVSFEKKTDYLKKTHTHKKSTIKPSH